MSERALRSRIGLRALMSGLAALRSSLTALRSDLTVLRSILKKDDDFTTRHRAQSWHYFFVCRETTANENHQPYRAKGMLFIRLESTCCLHTSPAGQRSFCPSSPDGQKRKNPPWLCGEYKFFLSLTHFLQQKIVLTCNETHLGTEYEQEKHLK